MESRPTFRAMHPISHWKDSYLSRTYRKSIRGDGLENLFVDEDDRRWMVGDYCKAVYCADGLLYECKVTSVLGDFCTVKFLGYGNTQKVKVDVLKPSDGKEARREQIRIAKALLNVNNDERGDEGSNHSASNGAVCHDPSPRRIMQRYEVSKSAADGPVCASSHRGYRSSHSTTASFAPRYPTSHWKNSHLTTTYRKSIRGDGLENLSVDEEDDRRANQSFMPPSTSKSEYKGYCFSHYLFQSDGRNGSSVLPQSPGIPAPPMLPEAPHLLSQNPAIPNDLAPVLSAWYLSGYYTGLYQAGKRNHGCHCSSNCSN